ncbi:MAG: SprT family zinc-dependent metalloprotease [Candidatus Dojkabacteria bacterium]|nr:SprT family zinc-dependent metalloprotease [Candidatus Dojkabacteria bacterium]MDQ7020551.1 SprT family zinc-dependent metalloprotease [Candidatus Dojkabacteria bacterium]
MKFLDHGKTLNLLGEPVKINYKNTKFIKESVLNRNGELEVYLSETKRNNHKDILYAWLRKQAKSEISKRTEVIASSYGFLYNRISVKDQKSRWGSCSSKKNLNFNWKLILVDKIEMDYVIVHELAHLRQMNHSSKFWDIVESIMPRYKEIKRNLRSKEKNLMQ